MDYTNLKQASVNKGRKGTFLNFTIEEGDFVIKGAFLYKEKGAHGKLVKLVANCKNGSVCRAIEVLAQNMVKARNQ